MSNSTDIRAPLKQELHAIDYQWVALESLSDVLCVMMAVFVGLPGLRKLWPYHDGYAGTKKGFIWLAARWGVGNFPHLFRTCIGIVEVYVFVACMTCFLPSPSAQLITCTGLVAGIAVCLAFFVTHWSDAWKQKLPPITHLLQAAVALAIRLFQDFDWADRRHKLCLYAFASLTGLGLLYMCYRRLRYGKVPDPLLG